MRCFQIGVWLVGVQIYCFAGWCWVVFSTMFNHQHPLLLKGFMTKWPIDPSGWARFSSGLVLLEHKHIAFCLLDFSLSKNELVGGNSFFFSARKLGKMNPNWRIFFKGVGCNHQLDGKNQMTLLRGIMVNVPYLKKTSPNTAWCHDEKRGPVTNSGDVDFWWKGNGFRDGSDWRNYCHSTMHTDVQLKCPCMCVFL